MAVPDFQTIMLPLLRSLEGGQERRINDLVEHLADGFNLTPEERAELLPSGRQARFTNRIHWAVTHLYKAGLLDRPGRGRVRLTERGRRVLRTDPGRIDMALLARYPEYRQFQRTPNGAQPDGPVAQSNTKTPEEMLEASYQSLRSILAGDLLDRIGNCSPVFFERLVVDLLVAMGYGGSRRDAGLAVGRSGDGGIDGIIKEDKLGLDFVYVQAKRWSGAVSRPDIQAFAGSLEGQRARKGVFITTSKFTSDAHDYVTRIEKRIVLIDGEQLAQLMIDHGVGVADVALYHVKKIDTDYFEE
jgi:restriction system protein